MSNCEDESKAPEIFVYTISYKEPVITEDSSPFEIYGKFVKIVERYSGNETREIEHVKSWEDFYNYLNGKLFGQLILVPC